MLIIGITGTLGAGKGTIVDYLVSEKGYSHFSVRGFLLEIIRKKGLKENRDSMVIVANELRQKYGNSYIVEQLFIEAKKKSENTIIESIRNIGEIEGLKKLGNFILLAVDASPKIRYERILNRKSETDNISFDEFLENEKREMKSAEKHSQNIFACMQKADYIFTNNGSIEELYVQIDNFLDNIKI